MELRGSILAVWLQAVASLVAIVVAAISLWFVREADGELSEGPDGVNPYYVGGLGGAPDYVLLDPKHIEVDLLGKGSFELISHQTAVHGGRQCDLNEQLEVAMKAQKYGARLFALTPASLISI